MKAIAFKANGGPEVLQVLDVPDPEPRPQDLLVRVKAFAVNPVDVKVRAGKMGAEIPESGRIIGWDGAGVVEAVGEGADRFAVGDEVFFAGDITRPGCYAELVAIDSRIVARKPRNLSFAEAAAMPLTSLTAWEALLENMRAPLGVPVRPMHCLIVGGAGGVGSVAIQIAKRVCGLEVIATASRPESTAWCHELGADNVINHTAAFAPQVQALGLRGVEYVLSTAEEWPLSEITSVLNPLGKICFITGGKSAANVDLTPLFTIRGTITLELMFTRAMLEEEPEKQGMILEQVSGLLESGQFRSTLTKTMNWSEIGEAHKLLETGRTIGKIALVIE